MILLRWVLLVTWLAGIFWSSLYIVELVAYSVRMQMPVLSTMYALLTVGMFSQLWCATNLFVVILVEQTIPSGQFRDFLLRLVEKSTSRVLKALITRMYGTDRKDTESGEVAVGLNSEVLARLDRLEKLLQTFLTKQQRDDEGEREAQFENGPPATLPEVDDLGDSSTDVVVSTTGLPETR